MRFGPDKRAEIEINLTPLIDVVFLLLIFFMVSTKFISDSAIEVELPFAGNVEVIGDSLWLDIFLTEDGEIILNDRVLGKPDNKTLQNIFGRLMKETEREVVLSVHADGGVNYQVVIDVMDAARSAGVPKVAFATQSRRSQ